ncbi:MAG: hypothetical protein QM780_00730 [Hyphomicrobium sp.]|uniref:hypothetical protein n=1 Tax=Hyphomicrobium sp. TaxID=82 RepID=UPI0039E51BDA
MALFSDGNHDNHPGFGSTGEGDGALDALIIFLLFAFSFAVWFICGALRPVLDDTNPSLMANPAPVSVSYTDPRAPTSK